MAEIDLVHESIHDSPVLLLDDVMSELDANRQENLIAKIQGIQTFITCTGMVFQFIDVLQTGSFRNVSAIHQDMDSDSADAFCLGFLYHSLEMRNVGVDIAIRQQSQEMRGMTLGIGGVRPLSIILMLWRDMKIDYYNMLRAHTDRKVYRQVVVIAAVDVIIPVDLMKGEDREDRS